VEDHRQGWRLRHRVSDAPLGAPLTVIFARREDARRGGQSPDRPRICGYPASVTSCTTGRQVRASWLACGAAPVGLPPGRARQAVAPQSVLAQRLSLWPVVVLGISVTRYTDSFALLRPILPGGLDGWRAEGEPLKSFLEKVVTGQDGACSAVS
jgi:hypothetical protein